MANAQKPDLVSAKRTSPFKSAGTSVQSTIGSRGVPSAVVMLDTPCSEVVWKVLATHSIRQFPLHFPARASPCAITFQLDSTTILPQPIKQNSMVFFSPDPRNGATIQRQTFRDGVISYLDGFLSSLRKVTCFPGQQISRNQNWESIFPLKNFALINHYKKPKLAEIYRITVVLIMPNFVYIGQLLQTL